MTQNAGLIVFFLLNAFPGFTFSQYPPAGLPAAWVSFVHDAQLRYGQASLAVLNAQTGNLDFGRNQNTGMATASTLKVITTTSDFYLERKSVSTGQRESASVSLWVGRIIKK